MRLCYSCDTPSGIQNNSIITIDQENKKPHVVAAALRHPNVLMLEPRLTTPTREAWSVALLMCCAGAMRNTILRCLHHGLGFWKRSKHDPWRPHCFKQLSTTLVYIYRERQLEETPTQSLQRSMGRVPLHGWEVRSSQCSRRSERRI